MRMEMTFMVRVAVGGRLMKAHGIGEWDIKNLVVSGCHLPQQLGQQDDFLPGKFGKRSQMATAANQDFEWPDRPEGYQGDETLVLADHANLLLVLQANVITQ